MSTFEDAIPTILRHEGGFNNDPVDAGGATNYGVSLRWLKAQGLLEDLEQQDRTQDEIRSHQADDSRASRRAIQIVLVEPVQLRRD